MSALGGTDRDSSIELQQFPRDRATNDGSFYTAPKDRAYDFETRSVETGDNVVDDTDVDSRGHEEYLDGGFGWVIVACTFLIAFHFLGLLYAWGVIQADLSKRGLGGSQSLSLIGGLDAFFTAAMCLPTSYVIRAYGPRITGMVGVLVLSISLIACSFVTNNLAGMLALQGVCVGIANGALFMTVYPLPSQFFMRKRGLATGITSCGGGVGGAVWSVIVEKLIHEIGLSWTYRVLGLSTLVVCLPAAYILRPGVQPRPTQPLRGTNLTPTPEKSIFRSSMYLRVVLTCVIVSWPFFIPPFFLPQYAVSIGMTASQGALFSALYNISSGIGRIGFGFVADMFVGNLTSWIISLLSILLSSLTVWPFSVTFASVAGFSIWCGLGSGGFFSLQSSIVGQVVGNHRIHQAIGWIEMAQSFGGLVGPLTAGLLLDKFGGTDAGAAPYKPAMYLVGGTTAVATLLALSVRASYTRKVFVKA